MTAYPQWNGLNLCPIDHRICWIILVPATKPEAADTQVGPGDQSQIENYG